MALKPIPILSAPGIRRDGTQFDSESYIDGQWCRFQRNRPRKMGGYRAVASTVPERTYGMHVFSQTGTQFAHLGGQTTLTQLQMDQFGNLTGQHARVPGGFVGSVDNDWQFDILFDDVGAANQIVAHAGQNLSLIDSAVETPIYVGDATGITALTASAMDPQSGGIVVLAPYLLSYGNAGRIDISPAADPAGVPVNTVFATGSKIVRGLPLRGNGAGPSGIFWSLDSVLRATFSGSTNGYFAFDTISAQSSVLSSRGVIEYDGNFYWLGIDRALMFNGVVQVLKNDQNVNWFFDNLNMQQRQKVFVFKIPRFGEIWWCFPFGNATECTHALIYNVDGKFWYDTALPTAVQAGGGRTDGYFAQVYSKPFMADQMLTAEPGYSLWQHETGTDSINGSSIQPIQSFFQTANISMLIGDDATNRALRVGLVEPDFVQSGNLTMTVQGRQNARAADVSSQVFTITPAATTPQQETQPLKEVRRLMNFRFESNVAGGNYQMGRTLAHIEPADGRERT